MGSQEPDLLPQDLEERLQARNYESARRGRKRYKVARRHRIDLLYRLVRYDRRFDIFVKHVLKLRPEPHQERMMAWQDTHDEGLVLVWRGAGKTTYLTEARAAFEIIVDPNVRILLASDAQTQSKDFLRAIKSYLRMQEVEEIFGSFYEGAEAWASDHIIVGQRTSVGVREPTVMCVGIDTVLPSRHFDILFADDLVTEDNSRTEGQRDKTWTYYFKTLDPCLKKRGGKKWIIGTRYHEQDLYGRLSATEFSAPGATYVLGVLDEDDNSRWEAEFPTEKMRKLRALNLAIFELQYECVTGGLLGGVFLQDHFQLIQSADLIPSAACVKWQAVDLAIGQRSKHDFLAHITFMMQRLVRNPYLLEWHLRRMTFPQQVKFVASQYAKHQDTLRVVIERNAYQDALRQQVLDDYPDIPAVGQWTIKDKMTRAQQVALFLTNHPLRYLPEHEAFMRLICGFPDRKGSKDAFDALELGLARALRGARRDRRNEDGDGGNEDVGLI